MNKLALIPILACMLAACSTRKCNDLPNPETGSDYFGERRECPDGTVCTYNLASVSLRVVDAAGSPVMVDSFVVTNRAGVIVPPNAEGHPVWGESSGANGNYTVLSDAWVEGHQGLGSYFLAKGFSSGAMVFSETFRISADCCHISKISGPEQIVVR
jgi:hypothetical protein